VARGRQPATTDRLIDAIIGRFELLAELRMGRPQPEFGEGINAKGKSEVITGVKAADACSGSDPDTGQLWPEPSRIDSAPYCPEAIDMKTSGRRWCGIVLVAVLAAPAAALAQTVRDFSQLPGILRKGQALVVTDQNRTKVTGRLMSVSATELMITTKTGETLTFRAISVREIRPPDPWWNGALIGGGIAAIPVGLAAANANEPGAFPAALVVIGAFAGVGAGIDALIQAPKLYSPLRQGIVTIAPIVNRDRKGVRLAWRF